MTGGSPRALAVVVPTHQRRDLVVGLVRALAGQTLPRERFEVALVCDGCTDGTAAAARALTAPGAPAAGMALHVIEQPRSGAATARNRGASATSAPLLLFLDDDMGPESACLAAHIGAHDGHPGALVLGHMPVHPDSPRSFLTDGLAGWATRRHRRLAGPGPPPGFTDVLTGHLSIARDAFEALGGFDAAFTAGGSFGGEDIEFGWRAVAHGVPVVYAPEAVAAQRYVKTFRALARDIREGARADAALSRKHPDAAATLTSPTTSLRDRTVEAFTHRFPRLAALAAAPAIALLDRAARAGATGSSWESLHAAVRAHLRSAALTPRR